MIDTQGGKWGGISRGLEAGLGLGNQMRAQQEQQREFGLEYGLKQRGEERMDREEQMRFNQTRADTLNKMMETSSNRLVGLSRAASEAKDDASKGNYYQLMADEMQRLKGYQGMLNGSNGALVRGYGSQVLDGVQTAQDNAQKLASGQIHHSDLTPKENWNVLATIPPHDPTAFLPDDETGDSKVGGHIADTHAAAAKGDWPSVIKHSSHIVAPISGSYDKNNPIPQVSEDIGRVGTVNAAIASDPDYVKMIRQAAADGAGDETAFARTVLGLAGGTGQLAQQLEAPSEAERNFAFVKKNAKAQALADGKSDAEAEKMAQDKAMAVTASDPMAIELERGKIDIQKANIEAGATVKAAQVRAAAVGQGGLKGLLASYQDQYEQGMISKPQLDQLVNAANNTFANRYNKNPQIQTTGQRVDANGNIIYDKGQVHQNPDGSVTIVPVPQQGAAPGTTSPAQPPPQGADQTPGLPDLPPGYVPGNPPAVAAPPG